MVVAVTAVGVVQMVTDDVVDVTGVRGRLVPAARAVMVCTIVPTTGVVRCAVRRPIEFVLLGPLAVHVVQMAIVQVVDVGLVPHGRVPAAAAMDVRVVDVGLIAHGRPLDLRGWPRLR